MNAIDHHWPVRPVMRMANERGEGGWPRIATLVMRNSRAHRVQQDQGVVEHRSWPDAVQAHPVGAADNQRRLGVDVGRVPRARPTQPRVPAAARSRRFLFWPWEQRQACGGHACVDKDQGRRRTSFPLNATQPIPWGSADVEATPQRRGRSVTGASNRTQPLFPATGRPRRPGRARRAATSPGHKLGSIGPRPWSIPG